LYLIHPPTLLENIKLYIIENHVSLKEVFGEKNIIEIPLTKRCVIQLSNIDVLEKLVNEIKECTYDCYNEYTINSFDNGKKHEILTRIKLPGVLTYPVILSEMEILITYFEHSFKYHITKFVDEYFIREENPLK
jgi:hypothetical protein